MRANTADVVFDYQGALSLARQLWALADEVTHTAGSRRDLAHTHQQQPLMGL